MRAIPIKKSVAVAGFLLALAPSISSAEFFVAQLSGSAENPTNTSNATGFFQWNFVSANATSGYQLAFRGLESNVTMAHIHLGHPWVAGPIVIWLCQTAANPAPPAVAANTPQCGGARAGVVAGNATTGINAAKVLGAPDQSLENGNLLELITNAVRLGTAYVNVHTTALPGGEIRGQLKSGGNQ